MNQERDFCDEADRVIAELVNRCPVESLLPLALILQMHQGVAWQKLVGYIARQAVAQALDERLYAAQEFGEVTN